LFFTFFYIPSLVCKNVCWFYKLGMNLHFDLICLRFCISWIIIQICHCSNVVLKSFIFSSVFNGKRSQSRREGRHLLLEVQHWRRLHPLAGGDGGHARLRRHQRVWTRKHPNDRSRSRLRSRARTEGLHPVPEEQVPPQRPAATASTSASTADTGGRALASEQSGTIKKDEKVIFEHFLFFSDNYDIFRRPKKHKAVWLQKRMQKKVRKVKMKSQNQK